MVAAYQLDEFVGVARTLAIAVCRVNSIITARNGPRKGRRSGAKERVRRL